MPLYDYCCPQGHVFEQMAAYQYPRQDEFLDELPKTVSGKLLRRELRARG